jgi:hypothetical protein
VQVYDGGEEGLMSTSLNELFVARGLFEPWHERLAIVSPAAVEEE